MSEKTTADTDPFFIGWEPTPPSYRRWLVPLGVGLVVAAAVLGALLAAGQRDPGPGRWQDTAESLDGLLLARPYALLIVPGVAPGSSRTLLLVEEGKFGALARVAPLVADSPEGVPVRVRGTLIERSGQGVLELEAGPAAVQSLEGAEADRLAALGGPDEVLAERATLVGEVIDPKCYLGAMRPGGGKTHKACAMLCLAGGVPPMLVLRDGAGGEEFVLLTTADGRPAGELVAPVVGEPVTLTGRLVRRGDLRVLQLAPTRHTGG